MVLGWMNERTINIDLLCFWRIRASGSINFQLLALLPSTDDYDIAAGV